MNKPEAIAAIVAITQLFKENGFPHKWCPFVAILLGALLGYSEQPNSKGIVDGIILGATVTGGYAVVKGTAQEGMKPRKTSINMLEHDEDRGV